MTVLSPELKSRLLLLQTDPRGSGATKALILEAEEVLGSRLPGKYRSFLESVGWGGIAHFEFYGLGGSVPPFLDLVQETLYERTAGHPRLPYHLIPILNDGLGNHYCLDVTRIVDGDCPVVFWNHELGEHQVPELEEQSFEIWLTKLLDSLEET